jgi:putative membrane protein
LRAVCAAAPEDGAARASFRQPPVLLRWLLAAVHLLALGVGLGAVWVRARAFRGPFDPAALRRVLAADTLWGAAAILWIGTGLWRLLASTEKPTRYYLENYFFWLKMSALLGILLLEIAPMATLIRWRIQSSRGLAVDTRRAPVYAAISYTEAVLVVIMVLAATAMARGLGAMR